MNHKTELPLEPMGTLESVCRLVKSEYLRPIAWHEDYGEWSAIYGPEEAGVGFMGFPVEALKPKRKPQTLNPKP